jgi:hypothetical protein
MITKKKVTKVQKQSEIDLLLRAVTVEFPNDCIAPGIVVAYLSGKQ